MPVSGGVVSVVVMARFLPRSVGCESGAQGGRPRARSLRRSSRSSGLTSTGLRRCGACPQPGRPTNRPPRGLGQRAPPRRPGERSPPRRGSRAPGTRAGRIAPAVAQRESIARSEHRGGQRLGVGLRGPGRRHPRSAWSSAARRTSRRRRSRGNPGSRAASSRAFHFAQPSSVSSRSVKRDITRARSGETGASGTAGPMKTAPSTRSGCSAASSRPRWAPCDQHTITALLGVGGVHHRHRVGRRTRSPRRRRDRAADRCGRCRAGRR